MGCSEMPLEQRVLGWSCSLPLSERRWGGGMQRAEAGLAPTGSDCCLEQQAGSRASQKRLDFVAPLPRKDPEARAGLQTSREPRLHFGLTRQSPAAPLSQNPRVGPIQSWRSGHPGQPGSLLEVAALGGIERLGGAHAGTLVALARTCSVGDFPSKG